MTKREVALLLEEIDIAYPGRLIQDERTLNTWYDYLKSQDKEKVFRRLKRHVKESRFLPTIADLYDTDMDTIHYFTEDDLFPEER